MKNNLGKTKDSGFQVGVRKTFEVELKNVWDFLFSNSGIKYWLGNLEFKDFINGDVINTPDNVSLKLTTLKQYSHVRMKWKKKEWQNESILQVRFIPSKEKTTISFHQEKLSGPEQRTEMKNHWKNCITNLERSLKDLQG